MCVETAYGVCAGGVGSWLKRGYTIWPLSPEVRKLRLKYIWLQKLCWSFYWVVKVKLLCCFQWAEETLRRELNSAARGGVWHHLQTRRRVSECSHIKSVKGLNFIKSLDFGYEPLDHWDLEIESRSGHNCTASIYCVLVFCVGRSNVWRT